MERVRTALALSSIVCGLVVVVQLSGVFAGPSLVQVDDYAEYWSAGRLNMAGLNPYDPAQLLPLQLGLGRTDGVPLMMWNPPWVLALAMPLAVLPYQTSRAVWFVLSISAMAVSARWLWLDQGGTEGRTGLALGIAFCFYPTFVLLQMGQITALVLLGYAGFLHFRCRRGYVAGGFAALVAIKPHLMYLFWPALILWAVSRRRWQELAAAAGCLAVATGFATAANPQVLAHYYVALTSRPPMDWATPTLGGVLRWLFGFSQLHLQFLPAAAGAGWLAINWRELDRQQDWRRVAPMLALVSAVTAAYGWPFDLVVLLAAPMAVAVSITTAPLAPIRSLVTAAGYVGLNLIAFLRHSGSDLFYSFWFGPVLLMWYLYGTRATNRE